MVRMNHESKTLEQQLNTLDKRLDRLRILYDQYFHGIERTEPASEREAIVKLIQDMRKTQIRNTALRFRVNQLVARISSYQNYWARICRQIGEGTYHRDIFKAKYRSKQKQQEESSEQDAPLSSRVPKGQKDTGLPGITQDNFNKLFDAYILAKRRCRENTKGLTKEVLHSSLRKQVPVLMKKYNCSRVEFKVVIKQGKAILKAIPKS